MIVIKKHTRTGHKYRYWQESTRINGKVVTHSVYLGPLIPRRRGGFVVFGLATMGIKAATGQLGPAGGKPYHGRLPPPDPRSSPDTSRDAWKIQMSTMSDEAWQRHIAGVKAELGSKADTAVTPANAPAPEKGEDGEDGKGEKE